MLWKLLKYELKGTSHYFLPLFAAVLVFSLLVRLVGGVFIYKAEWISGLLIFIEVLLITALIVMMMVITIQRFYKNLLGAEGYLMFTLPVSTHHNILSKLLAATLWTIACGLVIALSIIIMVWETDIHQIFSVMWRNFYMNVRIKMGLNLILMLTEWSIIGLISVASNILVLYLAMAIGQLANERKFLASFGAYVGLQITLTTITSILNTIISPLSSSWLWFYGVITWVISLDPVVGTQLVTLSVAGFCIIVGGIYYFFTYRLLKRRLNLT